jgi:hypothetical protein
VWNYEYNYYKKYYTDYSSIPYFLFEPDSDRNTPIYFGGYYNSTHPLLRKQNFGYYSTSLTDTFNYSFPSVPSSGYHQYFEQLTGFTLIYDDNVSTNSSDFNGVRYGPLFNLSIDFSTSFNSSSVEFTEVDGNSFYINSSYFDNQIIRETDSINLSLSHYAYSTLEYIDHNISIKFSANWSVFVRESNKTLLQFGFDLLTPFLVFIMFPIAMKNMGSRKGKLLGVLIGSAVGFFIMGYIGYMSLINSILLAMLTLFSLFVLYKRDSQI